YSPIGAHGGDHIVQGGGPGGRVQRGALDARHDRGEPLDRHRHVNRPVGQGETGDGAQSIGQRARTAREQPATRFFHPGESAVALRISSVRMRTASGESCSTRGATASLPREVLSMPTAVDFAARFIDPAAIRAAGHSAVLVYVSPSRPGANFGAKPVTREYADRLRAAGLEVVSIWQYGKPGNPQAPSDWTTGVDGGRRMAQQAAQIHAAAGGPEGCPIFFAVDEDISLQQWNTGAVHFFRGVNEAIGRQRTGVYGSSLVCAWAVGDDVVGRSTTPGKRLAWPTRAWSGNRLDT